MAIIRTPWTRTDLHTDHHKEGGSHDIGRSGRGWTVVVGAAAVAVASLTVQVAAAGGGVRTDPLFTVADPAPPDGRTRPVDPYTACMLDAPGTADSLEHWVDICRDRAERAAVIEAEFTTCMLDAPGTADSRDRWTDVCRDRAQP